MKSFTLSALCALLLSATLACNDLAGVGSSLAEENISIIVDSSYTIQTSTLRNPVVQSRTISQLIGAISAPGYGSITSNFVGQMMPSKTIDVADMTAQNIDSVKLFVQMVRGNFVGDSLVPMGLEVYRLTRDLPYPIFSDFDPDGYYDPQPLASTVYTASTVNQPDSINRLNVIFQALPLPKSFGIELFDAYKANPEAFSDPEIFAKQVFKGLYLKSSYGSGRITDFSQTSVRLYYHKAVYNTDSARYETKNLIGDYLAVTPEVVVNNNISYTPAPELTALVSAGKTILAAPAGYEAELTFPASEILQTYNGYQNRERVLNSLSFSLAAEEIENEYNITPPPYVLLVLKNKKEEFFANNSLTDNKTSFYASYDSASKSYKFTAMREYLLYLLDKESVTPDDYTFTLTPVQVNTEAGASSSYYYQAPTVVTGIVPYVSKPAMCKILPEKSKIKLTFSAGNNKNL